MDRCEAAVKHVGFRGKYGTDHDFVVMMLLEDPDPQSGLKHCSKG